MKLLIVTFVVVIAAIAVSGKKSKADWAAYKEAHRKNYDARTDSLRRALYQKKAVEIEVHNSNPNNDFQRELNQFSDMTDDEKEAYLGISDPVAERFLKESTVDYSNYASLGDRQLPPASLDYRTNSCLSAIVKNQGACGSCWAFSALTPLEFSYCSKYKTAIVLSEQQLVDCDTYDNGCNGGWPMNAWIYIKNVAKSSAKQAQYAYTAKKATCKFNNATMIGAKVSSYGYVTAKNPTAMQAALQKYGPLSVAIAVVSPFYSYASGVYTDKACDTVQVNHGVVVVGWGALNGVNYWIVRNSWGGTWGQKGYILMQRDVNKCQIETYPMYVVAA